MQVHHAIWERTRGNQFERDIPMARSDQRNPFADHHRDDVDRELIDRACIQTRRDYFRTAHHPYVLASYGP